MCVVPFFSLFCSKGQKLTYGPSDFKEAGCSSIDLLLCDFGRPSIPQEPNFLYLLNEKVQWAIL